VALDQVDYFAPSKGKLFKRVFFGRASLLERVKAHCILCMGYVSDEIPLCPSPECPFWDVRPYQKAQAKAKKVSVA
jgi:hypothetical protein